MRPLSSCSLQQHRAEAAPCHAAGRPHHARTAISSEYNCSRIKVAAALPKYPPQHLSTASTSCSRSDSGSGYHRHAYSLSRVARLQQPVGLDASSSPASVMEQALAEAACALAKQGYDDRRVVVGFLQQARYKLLEVDSAHVASTMWALANLHLEDPRFLHQLLHHIRPRLWACTPQALANTAVAIARSKHHDSAFVQLLLLHCRSKLSLFSPGLLPSLAWALAVLNHSNAGCVESLVQQLLRDPSKLQQQQLCVLLWSLSILEHDTAATSPPLVVAACRRCMPRAPSTLLARFNGAPGNRRAAAAGAPICGDPGARGGSRC